MIRHLRRELESPKRIYYDVPLPGEHCKTFKDYENFIKSEFKSFSREIAHRIIFYKTGKLSEFCKVYCPFHMEKIINSHIDNIKWPENEQFVDELSMFDLTINIEKSQDRSFKLITQSPFLEEEIVVNVEIF